MAFRIYHPATAKVVNLYSTNPTAAVTNGTRLLLYSWQNNNDQKWELSYVGSSVLMKLARDTSKVMNRHSTNNNAHVWTYTNNAETNKDSLIDTETSGGNTRIKLVGHSNMYLTKNTNDNYLSWGPKITSDRQYFKLEDLGGSSGGSDVTISMPVNINQNQKGFTTWFRNKGCAVCCGVNIASWKKGKNYNTYDFAGHYDSSTGYYWTGPDNFAFKDNEWLTNHTEAATIQVIRNYVLGGTPIACHAVGSGGREHWFVAYKATRSGGNTWATSGITVLDPYNSNENSASGVVRSISSAMSTSSVTLGIDRVRVPK